MSYDNLIEEAFDHPEFPLIVEKMNSVYEKEKAERHKFREWLTDDVKAEFINGKTVMHSPVKRGHFSANSLLSTLLVTYVEKYNLGEVAFEKALIGMTRNDYEPDICFWKKETAVDFDDDMMICPVPDFIVEILSKSTQKHDRGVKFDDYAAHGVNEYWLVDYQKQIIEQYILAGNKYKLSGKFKATQTIESQSISGFKIMVDAIFNRKSFMEAMPGIF
jgi:Uma2 family endonuclease